MTTVKATKVRGEDARPKRPKVDRGLEHEGLVRQIFALSVDQWFKERKESEPDFEMPEKEVRGDVVDNLTAQFCSAIETTVDAATACYLSTFGDDGDDGDVRCPKCDEAIIVEDGAEDGDSIKCPACQHAFMLRVLHCEARGCDTDFIVADEKVPSDAQVECPACGKDVEVEEIED